MKPKFRSLIVAFSPLSRSSLTVCALFCAVASARADQTWTGATDSLWTNASNWSTTSPGASDVAIFNATSTANLATTLGGDFSVLGLRVIDPTGAVSVATGNTLTIGASGINMSAATQDLTISSPLVINTAQTWNVASGRLLTISGTSTGSTAALTKSGEGTLQLNAAQLSATGSVLLSGGTSRANAGNFVNVFNSAPITFQNGASLVHWNGSSTVTLNSNMVVASGHSGTINMGARMTWGNNTDPTETLTGAGTLNLIAATTVARDDIYADMTAFTGTINFSGSGTVRLFINGGKVGAGFTGSTVDLAGSVFLSPQTNGGGNTINVNTLTGASATASLGGSGNSPTPAGSPNYSVGASGSDTTYAGGIRGNAALTKVGSGVLTLTNTSLLDFTAATNVNEGTLKMNGTKTGVGATSVNSGGTLTGVGSLAGTTTVASGGILAPGDSGTGNLTFASLTLNTGSKLKLGVTPSANQAVVQTGGTLTLQSGIEVDVNGFDTDGTYNIMNVTGATVSGSVTTSLTSVNGNAAKVYSFANTGTAIQMTISSSDPSNFWNVDGGGSWATPANWTKNPEIPNAAGAIAKFGPGQGGVSGSFTASFAVTLDDNKTVGVLSFADDFGAAITIDPGLVTPGTLLMDNGALSSEIVTVTGDHIINAPVSVDAQGVAVTLGSPFSLAINGVVSGTGAALTKAGSGTLVLAGNNTYDGGTFLGAGVTQINSSTSLGAVSGAATFSGGTLQLAAPLSSITRSYQLTAANSAIIDTNGNAFGYDGVISPVGGATGGLTKTGTGTMTLTAAQTYTGTTSVTGGMLELVTGGSINGAATNVTGGTLSVAGGSLNASALSSVTSSGISVSSGSAAFNAGLNGNTGNPSTNIFINLTGGTFSSSFLAMGRSVNTISDPTEGSTTEGFYINGAAVVANITGSLSVGTSGNSSASTRIDSGSLTVGGTVSISVNSPDRWSVIDVNGGTFTSTNEVTGVQIGSGQTGSDAFLVRGTGVATVERFLLQQPAASTETSLLNVSGGTLYVGAGGIVGNNNSGAGILDIQLGTATLGAKAGWSTLLGATLNGTTTIKAANAADVAQDISIAGVVSGAGGLDKTGAGTLTLAGANTYAGTTLVSAGKLSVTGDSSGALGAVTVSSGATLRGNGNIGGSVTIQSGGHHALAVAATSGAQVTRVISGSLTLNSGNILDLTSVGMVAGGTYVLATATGGITGTPTTVNLSGGVTGTVSVVGGNTLQLSVASSGYGSWASDPLNGLTAGVNDGPSQDPDNDGIENVLEFVLGGKPMLSDPSILPDLAVTATHFIFTFNREDDSEAEVGLAFQYGSNLTGWTPVVIGMNTATSGPEVVVTENADLPDTITVTITKGANTKLFGRLQAVK